MEPLLVKVMETGAAYSAALEELAAAAPELLKGRQEGPHQLQTIIGRIKKNVGWVEARVASIDSPPPAGTPAGIARRMAALEAAEASGDERAAKDLKDQLAALGA